jgi:hypothetical protein
MPEDARGKKGWLHSSMGDPEGSADPGAPKLHRCGDADARRRHEDLLAVMGAVFLCADYEYRVRPLLVVVRFPRGNVLGEEPRVV